MNRRRWLSTSLLAVAASALVPEVPRAASATSARIVVIGGGFGGGACALELRRLAPLHEVLLVDPDDPYTTCPGSNEVIVGDRPLADLRVERGGLRRAGVLVVRDRADAIDTGRRQVVLAGGARLPYDRLVLAPGIRFLWDRIEGMDTRAAQRMPHAWTAGEQTMLLAAQLAAMPAGGVVAISVPAGPMRCPPGPYERASLIAHYLKSRKPRAKLMILDANNSFPRLPLFFQAWQEHYPGLIEWIPVTRGGAVERVDARRMLLFAGGNAIHADVANVIPPQAPAALAPATGLAQEHGWCPVRPDTFESTQIPGVHVIGDACIADEMPKAASAALSQARQCAAAVAALLSGREAPSLQLDSVCYARIAPAQALAMPARFRIEDGRVVAVRSAAASPVSLDDAQAGREARAADRWYTSARAAAFAG